MLFNRQGLCLTANTKGTGMSHPCIGEIEGKHFAEVWPEEIRDTIRKYLERVLKGRQCSFDAYKMNGPEVAWWRMLLSPIPGPGGEVERFIAIGTDITLQREKEESLKLLNKAVEAINIGLTITNAEGRILYTNQSEAKMHGYSVEELIGRNVRMLAPQETWRDISLQQWASLEHLDRESMNVRKDGSVFPVNIKSVPVNDEDGIPIALISITEDITEKKAAEMDLLRKANHIEKMLDAFPSFAVLIDSKRRILQMNRVAKDLGGVIGRTCYETIAKYKSPCLWCRADLAFEENEFQNTKTWGMGVYWDAYWIPIEEDLYLHFAFDITELKLQEEELRRSREELRSLSMHKELVREEERKRISREIHDELGQELTALNMNIAWLGGKMKQAGPDLLEKIKTMSEAVNRTIGTVQRISRELRPGALDTLGLAAACENEIVRFKEMLGIDFNAGILIDEASLDTELSVALYRMLQEALTNIARHANASEVSIRLEYNGKEIVLEVKDNGVGIEAGRINDGFSFGLMGMQERAYMFGGKLTVSNEEEGGTTVMVRIPLHGKVQ